MKRKLLVSAIAAALVSSFSMTAPALAHQGENHQAVPQTAEGEGTVTALDAQAGTVTLNHGPIASLGWPAMTMTFRVHSAAVLQGVSVGQRVHFELMNDNGRPMVTEIHVL